MNVENRPSERERINPITLGVVVPILQSIVTGLLVGIFTAAVALATGAKFVPSLGYGLIAGIIVTLLMWLVLFIGRWQPLLERILRADLDGDGVIGAPEPRKEIRVVVEQEGGRRTTFLDLPFDEEGLRAFAMAALRGHTSVEAMKIAGVKRAALEEARQILFERGYAQWRAGEQNQGWELTGDGERALRSYLRGR